jgi:hypothetical protein
MRPSRRDSLRAIPQKAPQISGAEQLRELRSTYRLRWEWPTVIEKKWKSSRLHDSLRIHIPCRSDIFPFRRKPGTGWTISKGQEFLALRRAL